MTIPAALRTAAASDATLGKKVEHVHHVTKGIKEALTAAGNQYQDFNVWIFNLQLHWTLGNAAQGQGNAKNTQSGNGSFWGDSSVVPPGIVPGAYTLQVSPWGATLTLYNNDGKVILPATYFSGYADSTLSGFYTGTWASA